jgi:hypothetical protein
MNFLIEIDGLFYGYNHIVLLAIDRLLAQKSGCVVGGILRKTDDQLRTVYEPVSDEAFKAMLESERKRQTAFVNN